MVKLRTKGHSKLQCTDYELFFSLAELSVKMSHDTQSAILNLSQDDLAVTFSSQIVFIFFFFSPTILNKSVVMQTIHYLV